MGKVTAQINQGTGELEFYPDTFADVTPEMVENAQIVQSKIAGAKTQMEVSFLVIGKALAEAEKRHLYLALGYSSFKLWVESPEVEISYRVANDLVRIVNEIMPLLGSTEEAQIAVIKAGISKVRALLPLLGEANADQLIMELIEDAEHMTWKDLRKEVSKIKNQGEESPPPPVVFKAIVFPKESIDQIRVIGIEGERTETVASIAMPKEWTKRFTNLFGEFVEFKDEREI